MGNKRFCAVVLMLGIFAALPSVSNAADEAASPEAGAADAAADPAAGDAAPATPDPAPEPTPPPVAEPAAPPEPAAEEGGHMVGGNALIGCTGWGGGSTWLANLAFDPGIIVGLGVNFKYDGTLEDDKVTFGMVLHLEAMIVNKPVFAMGPELSFVGSFMPGDVFDEKVIAPGLAFWIAPWKGVPAVIGTAWDVNISIEPKTKAIIELAVPEIRFAWVFN